MSSKKFAQAPRVRLRRIKVSVMNRRTFSFRRIARGFLSAATALSIIMATLVVLPAWHATPVYSATYVETLAAHSDSIDLVDVSHPDNPEESEEI